MKNILLGVAAVILTTSTFAQEVRLGAKAGVNFATITGDNLENTDGRTGFHIGFVAEIPITEKFAVQPELIFSQQGLQSKTDTGIGEVESKLKLDYLNVPIMAKYYLMDGLSLEAGPQLGINVKAENESSFNGDTQTTDVSDSIETIDLAIGGGVAYRLPMGVFFQARYMFGISNLDAADEGGLIGSDLVNSNLSLSVGYTF